MLNFYIKDGLFPKIILQICHHVQSHKRKLLIKFVFSHDDEITTIM